MASRFEEAERNITQNPKVRVVRLWRVPFMDATGANNLRNFIRMNQRKNVTVILSGANDKVLDVLQKSGIITMVGAENVCKDVYDALERAKELMKA